MVNESKKAEMREKLNMGSDIQGSKIKVMVDGIEKVDGKLTATVNISGLPRKKDEDYDSTYRRIPKIFDSWKTLADYGEELFDMSDEDILKLCNTK